MKLLIAGEGGQGVQFISQILARAAFESGLFSVVIPNFGVEQRGGISLAFVQIDKEPIVYPKFEKATHAIIMSSRDSLRFQKYLDPATKIIDLADNKPEVPIKMINVFALGQLLAMAPIVSLEAVKKTLTEKLAKKNPQLQQINLEILEKGYSQI